MMTTCLLPPDSLQIAAYVPKQIALVFISLSKEREADRVREHCSVMCIRGVRHYLAGISGEIFLHSFEVWSFPVQLQYPCRPNENG